MLSMIPATSNSGAVREAESADGVGAEERCNGKRGRGSLEWVLVFSVDGARHRRGPDARWQGGL